MTALKIILLTLCVFLVSCGPKIHEVFSPAEVQWSLEKGATTLILHGQARNSLYPGGRDCESAHDGMIFPDTKYFDAWYRVQTSGSHFAEDISSDARQYIRHASAEPGCIYTFRNVPAGNWRILLDISWYTSGVAGTGPYYGHSRHVPAGPGITSGRIHIDGTETVIRKNFISDEGLTTNSDHPFRMPRHQAVLEPWAVP
ncbi:hypothetical protein [Acetobacter fallax]|uniref:Lipoprotein n=1 Tax=Acetobacter fallax TaxID=1737473 RepID=A0ABX0KEK9_9PROT|nr:hypothetical protein [Acetobacter fallax]NHO34032.1 hypothetical protein [Acetobacter fallax]NHO37566.1 hypothetical protein [Acetobacter fallax]